MASPSHWPMVPRYLQITHCVHSALECSKMTTSNFIHLCLVSYSLFIPLLLTDGTVISIQARSYSGDGNGHIHENIFPIPPQVLVFNGGILQIFLLLKLHWYLNPFRWHFMLTLIAVVIRFGKAWTIRTSSRGLE